MNKEEAVEWQIIRRYFKLLIGVSLGTRGTSYPLGVRWRWRHKGYKDL